jgi:formate dehydrogenase
MVMVLYPGNGHKAEFGELEGQPVPGSAEGEISLRRWLEDEGHELITTGRRGGELDQNLADAVVLITTPFWPVYVTLEMIESASSLKLILTAGVGSDHIDLAAAAENNITVAEQTNSNVVSVAEHAVMCVLNLVRNFVPQYKQVVDGE